MIKELTLKVEKEEGESGFWVKIYDGDIVECKFVLELFRKLDALKSIEDYVKKYANDNNTTVGLLRDESFMLTFTGVDVETEIINDEPSTTSHTLSDFILLSVVGWLFIEMIIKLFT